MIKATYKLNSNTAIYYKTLPDVNKLLGSYFMI